LIPTDETGTKNLSEIMEGEGEMIEDPSKDLCGKRLDFLVKIDNATLPEDFCKDTFVEYSLMNEDGSFSPFKTPLFNGREPFPNYNFIKHHTYLSVTEKLVEYLLNSNVNYIFCYK
jgi:kinesin family protein 13